MNTDSTFVFDKLWHYTTFDNFKNIWESQCLWAKDYRCLNDSSEFILSKEYFSEAVMFFIKKDSSLFYKLPENEWRAIIGTTIEILYQTTTGHNRDQFNISPLFVFVASFCFHEEEYTQNNGLLSQWRAYGGNEGIAIVFDAHKLSKLKDLESNSNQYVFSKFLPVIYDDNKEKIEQMINECVPGITLLVRDFAIKNKNLHYKHLEIRLDKEKKWAICTKFLESVSKCKHRGFKEESEVRIVKVPTLEENGSIPKAGAAC